MLRPTSLSVLLAALLPFLAASCGDPGTGAGGAEPAADRPGLVVLPPDEEPAAGLGPVMPDGLPDRPSYHSFGSVRNGAVVSHVFRLENRDPVPVTIQKIKPSCGCTVPRVRYTTPEGEVIRGAADTTSNEPVIVLPPGAVAEVEVQVDTREIPTKNAHKTQTILVSTDSPGSYYITLEVHILVERPFDLVPNGIRFGAVALAAEETGTVDVVGVPGFGHRVRGVLSAPEGVEVEIEELLDGPRPLWRVHVRLTAGMAAELGTWTDEVVLATEGEHGEPEEPLALPLTADRVPDVGTSPLRLVFRARRPGDSGRVTVETRLAGHYFAVQDVRFLEPAHAQVLEAAWAPLGEEVAGGAARWDLSLTVTEPERVREMLTGKLELALDDPQHPNVEVVYVVHPGLDE